jgi:hypothetical protein
VANFGSSSTFPLFYAFEKKRAQYVGVDDRSPFQEYAVGGELPRS